MIEETQIHRILSKQIFKEERSVGGYKYRKVLSDIVKLCANTVKNIPKMQLSTQYGDFNYIINVPGEYCKEIDFIDGLSITIYLKDYEFGNTRSGGGGTDVNTEKHTPGEKLKDVHIDIFGYCYEGRVFSKTIFTSLYHEISHCFEFYSRTGQEMVDAGNFIKDKYGLLSKHKFSQNNSVDYFFHQLFYRLFIKSEKNAMISSVYGDLAGLGSVRKNFHEDILKTQAGNLLLYFDKNLNVCIENSSISELLSCCKDFGLHFESLQEHEFIGRFKNLVQKIIHDTWKSVGRAASLWYDDAEEEQIIKEGIHNEFINYGINGGEERLRLKTPDEELNKDICL